MSRTSFPQLVKAWPAEERVKQAKSCVHALSDRVLTVIELHASNEIILYSSKLASQIPHSQAANAFTWFQDAMFGQEILKLLALWDPANENAISIPKAIALIDDGQVITTLANKHFSAHTSKVRRNLNPSEDPDIAHAISQMMQQHQTEFALSQSAKAAQILQACIDTVKEKINNPKMNSLRNFRDHQAHSVDKTRRELRRAVLSAQYGDERMLLDETIGLIEDLYCWVNGTSFDIRGRCFENARIAAGELWENCSFDIPER